MNRRIPPHKPIVDDIIRSNTESPDEAEKLVIQICGELDHYWSSHNWSDAVFNSLRHQNSAYMLGRLPNVYKNSPEARHMKQTDI